MFFNFIILDSSRPHHQNTPLTTSTTRIVPIVMLHIFTVLINSGERYKERDFLICLQSYIRRGEDYDGDGDGDPDPHFGQIRVWQGGVGCVDHGRMVGAGLFGDGD